MKEEDRGKMYLIWDKIDKSYSLLTDDCGEMIDTVTLGTINVSSNASDFITALNLLIGITDANYCGLTEPIDEIITKCVELVLEKQHQPV